MGRARESFELEKIVNAEDRKRSPADDERDPYAFHDQIITVITIIGRANGVLRPIVVFQFD